jgi:hypothetical protein
MVSATGSNPQEAWLDLIRSRTAAWIASWCQSNKRSSGAGTIHKPPQNVCPIDIIRFMQLARLRYPIVSYTETDPLPAILRRLVSSSDVGGNLALRKVSHAVLAGEGTLTSAELWLLDEEAVALLDRLTDWHRSGRYGTGVLRAAISLLTEA